MCTSQTQIKGRHNFNPFPLKYPRFAKLFCIENRRVECSAAGRAIQRRSNASTSTPVFRLLHAFHLLKCPPSEKRQCLQPNEDLYFLSIRPCPGWRYDSIVLSRQLQLFMLGGVFTMQVRSGDSKLATLQASHNCQLWANDSK